MDKRSRPLITIAGGLGVAAAIFSSDVFHFAAQHATRLVLWLGAAASLVLAIAGATARKLLQELFDYLGDLIRVGVKRRFTRYGHEYREFLWHSMVHMDTARLGRADLITKMDEVYVDLELAPYVADFQVSPVLVGVPKDLTARYSVWDFLEREENVVLAVLGRPGSGKTTLLRHVAVRMAKGEPRTRRRIVPAYVKLGELSTQVTGGEEGLRLADVLRKSASQLNVKEPPGWWEYQLAQGLCVVLLDGLDEVADPRRRAALGAWVQQQIGLNWRNHFIISSRPGGFQAAGIRADEQMQIRPFTSAQVEIFLNDWYRAIERKAAGAETPRSIETAHEKAADLLERLARAPALYELTVNPMLLTLIAGVHSLRKQLPDNRAELYREVFEVSLKDRTESGDRLPVGEQIKVLEALAYTMMDERIRVIPRVRALEVIGGELARHPAPRSAERFLEDLGTDGIVIEREEEEFEFGHLTFQEYLAGARLRRIGAADRLEAHVTDRWWRETILLYATWNRPDPIVRACLATDSIDALALAFDCAEDVHGRAKIDPRLQEALDATVDAAFEPEASPERLRFAAAVLASQQLKYFVRKVCRTPVTATLYELFLADTGHPAPDGRRKVASRSQEPVVGVWAEDAEAFLTWLNGICAQSVGGAEYRLPSALELDYVAARPDSAGSSRRPGAGTAGQGRGGGLGGVGAAGGRPRSVGTAERRAAPGPLPGGLRRDGGRLRGSAEHAGLPADAARHARHGPRPHPRDGRVAGRRDRPAGRRSQPAACDQPTHGDPLGQHPQPAS